MEELDDTLNVMLCSFCNQDLPIKSRAIKVSRLCKIIRDRTKSDTLRTACRTIIKATQEGRYQDVIRATELAEENYFGDTL